MYLTLFIIVALIVILSVIKNLSQGSKTRSARREFVAPQYKYSRKAEFITAREKDFYKVLQDVAGDRYYIFPQIHLSALFKNETVGKYHKLAFQIINRRSVDYVLCDKTTLEPVYAVELDDSTHDTAKSIKRDENVNQMFKNSNLPLVRFRNYSNLTKEDITNSFMNAHNAQGPTTNSPSVAEAFEETKK